MKNFLFTFLSLFLVSCSSPEREVYETGNGITIRSGDYIDYLRGANEKRDVEIMELSRKIISQAGQKKIDEYNTPYTGAVKIYIWENKKGGKNFVALREIKWRDGVVMWQGPNPPTKYYSVKNLTEIIITNFGPENQERLRKEGIL